MVDQKNDGVVTRPLQATLPINPSSACRAAEAIGFALLGDGIHARLEDCLVRIKLRLKKTSRREAEEQVRNAERAATQVHR